MKVFFCRLVSYMLVVSLVGLPLSTQATLIETDQVLRQAQAQTDRARMHDLVARADVQKALESYGVGARTAQQRVDALTDTEIQQIIGKLDSLPAGAGAAETVVIVVLLIVIIYVILQHVYPKK